MYFIDACDFCGVFKRVMLENVNDNQEVSVVCDECLNMYEEDFDEDEEENSVFIGEDDFTWEEVSV